MYMYSIGGTRPVKLSVGDTGVNYVTKLRKEILFVNEIFALQWLYKTASCQFDTGDPIFF